MCGHSVSTLVDLIQGRVGVNVSVNLTVSVSVNLRVSVSVNLRVSVSVSLRVCGDMDSKHTPVCEMESRVSLKSHLDGPHCGFHLSNDLSVPMCVCLCVCVCVCYDSCLCGNVSVCVMTRDCVL